jgi:hypothetical protein
VPLVKEEKYYDLVKFENDFKQLSKITLGYIKTIRLMGGEPLLNKDINKYIKIVRENFNKSDIWVVTNGILLPTMKDDFWQEMKKQNINIFVSSYPINLDMEIIELKRKKYNINIYFEHEHKKDDKMHLQPLTEKSVGGACYAWHKCCFKNCTFLKDGKIFICPQCANIEYFNKAFNKNLEITENDYVDIYKTNKLRELLDFINSPTPFCKYCDVDNIITNLKWKVSEEKMEEWYK